jgi:uncharacterized protein
MASSQPVDPERRAPLWIAPAAIGLGFFAAILLETLVQAIGTAFGSSFAHPTPAVNLVSYLVFDLGFVGAALYFIVLTGVMGPAELGYRRISWRLGAAAVLAAGLGYYVVTWVYSAVFALHGTDKLPSELKVTQSAAAAAGAAVFVCVIAPIVEEFFFRGFLFGVLRQMRVTIAGRQAGPWIAAVIVGLLFGLAHSGSANPRYLIPLGFLGFVLCLVRWWTGSLYPCMALHSLNNCVALGVNELNWNAGEILLLIAGSLTMIGLLTGPLSRPRTEPAGVRREPSQPATAD